MNIMLICTSGGIVNNFRQDLIDFLTEKGHVVTVIADYSDQKPLKNNYKAIDISVNNKSKNVFSALKYYCAIKKAVKQCGPDTVITFMIKPNTFGARAALKAPGVKVFSMIEGMGTVYTVDTLKYRAIRVITDFLYRSNMRKLSGLFCLNDYDAAYFKNGFISADKVHILPGIGLDTEKYAFSQINEHKTVAMFARLLREKGVEDYCKAAKIVKESDPEVKFLLYGQREKETDEIVDSYVAQGVIEYRGTTSDVTSAMKEVGVVVLPSYREGASRIIMEAMSCGRPVITYDVIGCNHLVDNGKNGIVVKKFDINALAEAIDQIVHNEIMSNEFGERAREKAEKVYDAKVINNTICDVITEVVGDTDK